MSYLIANQSTGIQKDLKPWIIPEEAYVNLVNAYIFRGRTEKKRGAQLLGPLSFAIIPGAPVALGATVAGATTSYSIPAFFPPGTFFGTVPKSLNLSINSIPVTTLIDLTGNGTLQSSGSDPITALIDYATSTVTITLPAGSPLGGLVLSFVSARTFPNNGLAVQRTPCMGIWTRQLASINFEQTIFFDQNYSYTYSATGFNRIGAPTSWTGNDSDFFWCVNVRNPLVGNTAGSNVNFFFATNFNVADPIRYLDSTDTWINFAPTIVAGPPVQQLLQARCIVQFKNRLLFFNTWEHDDAPIPVVRNYPNRLRFSWIGNPIDQGNGYLQSPAGKGGFIDAAIAEQIVSVAVLKDCILVKFETVSWRVVYTGNPYQPFEWQKVNQEFGSDSTFSSIQFDDFVLCVGNRAITQDTSVGVRRIDEKIPDEVFEISNDNNNPKRVWGVRDFFREQVYWTIPYPSSSNAIPTYPNRILNYSYRTNAFGFFKDVYTALGSFQNLTYYTWGDAPFTWGNAEFAWGSPALDLGFENISAGNQQGNIFLLQRKDENDHCYEITSITIAAGVATVTIPNHNLDNGDFVKFNTVQGFNFAGFVGPQVLSFNQTTFDATLLTTNSGDGTIQGGVIPGTVTVLYTQTAPALTVNFLDNGAGGLVATSGGFSGTIDYVSGDIQIVFPPVPGGVNVSTISVGYEYSLFNNRIYGVLNRTTNTFDLAVANSLDELVLANFGAPVPIDPFTFGQLAYLTDFAIVTKQFNPFVSGDRAINMPFVDLYLDGTDSGQIAMEIRTDDFNQTMNTPLTTYTDPQWRISTVALTERFWQRLFVNARGEFIQIAFTQTNQQMISGYSEEPFILHGLNLNMQQSGRLIRTKYP